MKPMIACTAATVPTSTENFHGFSRCRHSWPGRLRERQYPVGTRADADDQHGDGGDEADGETAPERPHTAAEDEQGDEAGGPGGEGPGEQGLGLHGEPARGGASAVVCTAVDAVMAGSYASRPAGGERTAHESRRPPRAVFQGRA